MSGCSISIIYFDGLEKKKNSEEKKVAKKDLWDGWMVDQLFSLPACGASSYNMHRFNMQTRFSMLLCSMNLKPNAVN